MPTRVIASTLAAATAAGLTLALVPAAPATAAPAAFVPSTYITKSQVPVTGRFGPWNHTPISTGVRSREECFQRALPRDTTKHRAVYNDAQGQYITQYVVRVPTTAAKKLVNRLTYCGSKAYIDAQPRDTAAVGTLTLTTYGRFDVENGLLVRGVRNKGGTYPGGVFLDAVGRDKRYVTLLHWPFKTEGAAPKDAWVTLSKKALRQLRP